MKTKQRFFRCAAVFAALASALAGCDRNDGAQGKITIPDDSNIKFVIKVADKPAGTESADAQTRALKSGWADGDKMVVFFGDTSANSVLVVYDAETEKWDRVAASVTELAASGTAHALHAGGSFSYDEGGFTDIEGDLLYDDAGVFTYDDFSETVTLTLTMERGLTSVVKMESPDGLPGNMDWRLAGEGLWVQTERDLAASNFSSGFTFGEVLESLFSESNASAGVATPPDATFTTADMAVFHVWNKTTTPGTSFKVYKNDAPTEIYSRTYAEDLTSGGSVLLAGPSSTGEEDEWSVSSTVTLVTPSALTVTAPVAGEAPSGSITTESVQFTATMEWITEDGEAVEGNFAPSTVYTADIRLTAAADYTFKDGVGDYDNLADIASFTVNGIAPTAFTSVSEDGTELFFDVQFSETEPVQPAFVPVTSITNLKTTATAGTDLILTGSVNPDTATNQAIMWSVVSAGTTGATISDATLKTTAAGTVKVKATVENGATQTSDYTYEYDITVSAAFVPVTSITDLKTTATAGTDIALTGTVNPGTATNQTITWSVVSAGTTGATISGSTLKTTAAGTVRVMATIVNGATSTTDYTYEYDISVDAADVNTGGGSDDWGDGGKIEL